MGKIMQIFLLAVMITSCEQEPLFTPEVNQMNTDTVKVFSEAYSFAQNNETMYILLGFYSIDSNGITAETKYEFVWNQWLDYAQNTNISSDAEQFMQWASGNLVDTFVIDIDVIVITNIDYINQQDKIDYQLGNQWNRFLVPFDIDTFYNNGDTVTEN